jgi:opacity protein-like surface antigen
MLLHGGPKGYAKTPVRMVQTKLDAMKLGVSVAFAFMVSLPAAAQDRGSAFVAGSVSAANMESRTEIAYSGAFGYRFSRVVSFVIEATGVPSVEPVFPTNPVILSTGAPPPSTSVAIYPGPTYSNLGGRIVMLTNTARIDIPTTSTRVTPFFSAGGGVASVRRTADFSYDFPVPLLPPGTPTLPIVRPYVQHLTSSSTDMALTLGGGAGVRVAKSLWLDVDLRLFRLLGDGDRNLGRFGVGVRYAF